MLGDNGLLKEKKKIEQGKDIGPAGRTFCFHFK